MLYMLTQIDNKTGVRTIIYGHVTSNVINDYWGAYVRNDCSVEISVFDTTGKDGNNDTGTGCI